MLNIKKYDLQSNFKEDKSKIGNKAWYLAKTAQMGIKIPNGYILTYDFLYDLLKNNNKLEEFLNISTQPVLLNRCRKLKSIIMGLIFPEEYHRELCTILEEFNYNIIVRSSSINEDNENNSMAGMYLSINKISTIEQLKTSILECFSSGYSRAIYNITGKIETGMSVIVQQYISAYYTGIAFSCDPIHRDRNSICINYKMTSENLTDGNDCGEIIYVNRNQVNLPSNLRHKNLFLELIKILTRLDREFKNPVDCEWLFLEEDVFILQVRPVVQKKSEIKEIVDIDDIKSMNGIYLNELEESNLKWFEKKYYVRKVCKELQIPIYAARYVYLYDEPTQRRQTAKQIRSIFKTLYSEIYDGKKYRIFKTSEIEEIFEQEYETSGSRYIRVCEYWITKFCGNATIMTNNNVYIESVMGGFYGLWKDGLPASVYEIDNNGKIIKQFEKMSSCYYSLSPITLEYEKKYIKTPRKHFLSAEHLGYIFQLCHRLKEKMGCVNIEWIGTDEGIRLFDISENNKPIGENEYTVNIISRGQASGEALFLKDISLLEDLFDDFITDIDVYPSQNFNYISEREETIAIINRVLENKKKPIVIAEFPNRVLALLKDYVSAFVFKRGAILCHLAIILRENEIPAIICPQVDQLIKDGDQIDIIGGKIFVNKT